MGSLNMSFSMESNYTFPSTGDISGDPDSDEATEVWHSFFEEEEDSDFSHKSPRIVKNLNGQTWDYKTLKNMRNTAPHPSLRPEDPIRYYTTQDKMLECQNGSYLINYLTAHQNFSKGVNVLNRDFMITYEKIFHKNEDGTVEVIDPDFISRQKKVLRMLLKQLGTVIFSGKSLASMSGPVFFFQPMSGLEQEASYYAHAPHFLEPAGQCRDPLEQFKLTIAHHISSLYLFLGPGAGKPFNPILGETFQGIINGCPIYSEQISHHPPIAALEMIGKNFKTESVTEITVSLSWTRFKLCRIGLQKVIFKNTNTVIKAQLPPLWANIGLGRRTIQFGQKLYVFDIENKLYAEIIFDYEDSKLKVSQDHFSGSIWRINDHFANKLRQLPKRRHELEKIKFKQHKHAVGLISQIEGMWLDYLKIDGKIYWSIQEHQPYKLQYFDHPLPSDSNFRLDVLNWREGNEDQAQEFKTMLEELQRKDKRARDSYRRKTKNR